MAGCHKTTSMWKVTSCEGESAGTVVGGVWELGCTLGLHSLVGSMDLGRVFIGQMELAAQVLSLKVSGTAYGAVNQGKVLWAKVSWQRGT